MSQTSRSHAHADRLALLRSEWPKRVTWSEVRAADSGVFRDATWGGLLVAPALFLALIWTMLNFEWPGVLELPDWIDWARGFLTVATFWGALMVGVLSAILIDRPRDLRRELAFRQFAESRDLSFARYGIPPKPRGIFFTEGLIKAPSRTRRTRRTARKTHLDETQFDVGAPQALFRVNYALSRGGMTEEPDLQLAVSGYSGGKSDPKGPRSVFRYLVLKLPRSLPHLMIDSRKNGNLRQYLPGQLRLSLEGDFDRHFSVYVPDGYDRDALELLTPDVMAGLIDYGRAWDIEVVEDRMIVVSHRVRSSSDRAETTALLLFAEVVGGDLSHQAVTYTDPRAERPRFDVAAPGRRLRKRSSAWMVMIFLGITAAFLAFPFVLDWLLDL